MKKLIAITGTDGTGKSTLVSTLVNHFENMHEVSIWDPMKRGLFQSKKDIDNYLCALSANARIQFLSHALTEALDMGMKQNKDTLLLNGYYYKYFASELALGASNELVMHLRNNFPTPDLVICLEVSSLTAANRKAKLSRYECGLNEPTQGNFVAFQNNLEIIWEQFKTPEWHLISAEEPKEIVAQKTLKLIQNQWG